MKSLTREARSIWSGAARQEIVLKFIHRGERLVRLTVRAEIGRLIPIIHRTNNKSYSWLVRVKGVELNVEHLQTKEIGVRTVSDNPNFGF